MTPAVSGITFDASTFSNTSSRLMFVPLVGVPLTAGAASTAADVVSAGCEAAAGSSLGVAASGSGVGGGLFENSATGTVWLASDAGVLERPQVHGAYHEP